MRACPDDGRAARVGRHGVADRSEKHPPHWPSLGRCVEDLFDDTSDDALGINRGPYSTGPCAARLSHEPEKLKHESEFERACGENRRPAAS